MHKEITMEEKLGEILIYQTENGLTDIEAVSYTHLDVYKRQGVRYFQYKKFWKFV